MYQVLNIKMDLLKTMESQRIIITLKASAQWQYKVGKVHRFLQKIAKAREVEGVKVLKARTNR